MPVRRPYFPAATLPPWLGRLVGSGGSTTMRQNQAGSQSAFLAIGGYDWPSRSILGSQVHHSSEGMFDMTIET